MQRKVSGRQKCAPSSKRLGFLPAARVLVSLLSITIILLPNPGFSEVAGHFSQIRTAVEQTKRGNPPPVQAKVQDKVEVLDAIRTDNSGKAAITFVDDSSLVISPLSYIIIDKTLVAFAPYNVL